MNFDLKTEKINYVKITYKDKDDFAHCIKASVRYINEKELLACKKYEENINIEVPQEVELALATDTGLYKSKTILKKTDKEEPYLLFSLQKPQDVIYQQNREYFRVKLQENSNIEYTEQEQVKCLSALTYDISANGVRIELEKAINFPDDAKIKLFLPQRTICVNAKYIRTDDDENVLKASFQFLDISQQDLDYISQLCLKKQLEDRRKNLLS